MSYTAKISETAFVILDLDSSVNVKQTFFITSQMKAHKNKRKRRVSKSRDDSGP